MKVLLFHVLFWVLGTAISLIVAGLYAFIDFIKVVNKSGLADPQFIAGIISETLVTYFLSLIFLTVIIAPMYLTLRKNIRYLWLFIVALATFLSFIADIIFANPGLLASTITWIGVGMFVLVGFELPYKILYLRRQKAALTVFD